MELSVKVSSLYHKKRIELTRLGSLIKPGHRIYLSSGAATPVNCLNYILETEHGNFLDLEIIQLDLILDLFRGSPHNPNKYRLKSFKFGENISKKPEMSNVDFIPSSTAEVPYLFLTGAVGIDIAIIQTSPPDWRGYLNLGVASDVAEIVIENTPLVIAEVNPNLPVTCGKTAVPLTAFDYIIESEQPLVEFLTGPYDEEMKKIAYYVEQLIEDESTVCLSTGRIFNAIAVELRKKRRLKIVTHVLSDWIMDLIDYGTVSRKKIFRPSPVMATSCIGTRELYDYIDRNPTIKIMPLLYAGYQRKIQSIPQLVSIIPVEKIDISGDLVVTSSDETRLTGFDGKLSFAHAANFSRGGKAIVVLKSVNENGDSNIVVSHDQESDNIRSTLGTTRLIVTEYGIANLFGKPVRERALALIDIAHPGHREALVRRARMAGIVYSDQLYKAGDAVKYPYEFQTEKIFKKKLKVFFRPIKASDEDMMRRLFYKFSDNARYMRYMSAVRTMTHRKMQSYVNIDYDQVMSFVGIVQYRGIEKIIAECRYSYYDEEYAYEIAFVVDEEYQGMGIASFMLDYLVKVAIEKDIKKFVAYVLPENNKMCKIFDNVCTDFSVHYVNDEKKYSFFLDRNFSKSLEGIDLF